MQFSPRPRRSINAPPPPCRKLVAATNELMASQSTNSRCSPSTGACRRKMNRANNMPVRVPARVIGATASTVATSTMLTLSKKMSARLRRSSTGHMNSSR